MIEVTSASLSTHIGPRPYSKELALKFCLDLCWEEESQTIEAQFGEILLDSPSWRQASGVYQWADDTVDGYTTFNDRWNVAHLRSLELERDGYQFHFRLTAITFLEQEGFQADDLEKTLHLTGQAEFTGFECQLPPLGIGNEAEAETVIAALLPAAEYGPRIFAGPFVTAARA